MDDPADESIRRAAHADADAIFDILTGFAVSHSPDRADFDTNYPALIAADNQLVPVAALNGRVVGYVMASRSLTLYANGPVAEIIELAVEPSSRSRGLGKRMVETVIEWARDCGCIEVNVPTRRAGAYYERLGFERTASYYRHET